MADMTHTPQDRDAAEVGAERGEVVDTRPAVITCYPDGPLLVRGNVVLTDSDGHAIPRRRRTVALCRCGKSGLAPFCDGTHKQIGFTAP